MRRTRIPLALTTAALALVWTGPASARPASDFATPAGLPAGTSSVGDRIVSAPTGALLRYGTQDGYPAVTPFGAGTLGTPTRIPGAPQNAIPGPVSFLPDGGAIFSYFKFNSGPLQLVLRRPDGTFGATYNANTDTAAFAARAGEVLVLKQSTSSTSPYPKVVTASSLSIGADGTLTPVGGAAVIYTAPGSDVDRYGTQIEAPIAALDPDAEAEAVIAVDHVEVSPGSEVLTVHRGADGVWGAPTSLSAGLPGAGFAGGIKAAVAPDGRALLSFQAGDGTSTTSRLYRSLRQPGDHGFPTPTLVSGLTGAGGTVITAYSAASGDGTVALGVAGFSCQSSSTAETPRRTLDVLLASPGKALTSFPVSVQTASTGRTFVDSLGAGGGNAVVGLRDDVVTSGPVSNVCGSNVTNGQAGVVSDRVALVGPGGSTDRTFGSGGFSTQGDGSVHLAVDAGGIDALGNAAVTGRLVTSDVPAFSSQPDAGSGTVAPAGSGGSGSGGSGGGSTGDGGTSTGGGGATTGSGGSTSSGTGTGTGKAPGAVIPAPANTASPQARSSATTLSSSGVVTVSLTAPALSGADVLGEQLVLRVFSGAGSRASAAAARRLIGSVTKTVKLRSKQKLKVRIKLTKKLRRYVAAHAKATLELQLTSRQTGHAKTVAKRAVRRPKPRR